MKVAELLSDESKWTTRFLARDVNNNSCHFNEIYACKWCMLGAILKCYGRDLDGYNKAHLKIRDMTGYDIVGFNDSATYEEVMAVVRKADI
jgi:hypothetical protein